MRWCFTALACLAILGCNSRSETLALDKPDGPKVDITVEPLRWANQPIANGRAQQLVPPPEEPKKPRKKRKKPKPSKPAPPEQDIFGQMSEEERRRLIEG